jgi:hypothetical protein
MLEEEEEEEKCYLGEALYLEEVGLVDEVGADMIKQNGQS